MENGEKIPEAQKLTKHRFLDEIKHKAVQVSGKGGEQGNRPSNDATGKKAPTKWHALQDNIGQMKVSSPLANE